MAPVETQVLDVGRTGLTDPESVEAEEHIQGGVVVAEVLGREEECPELGSVLPLRSDGKTRGRRTYWAGLAGTCPSMCAKR
jgi:hypothetical protein